jgi:Mrp family chromosome partitioning ATPase
MSGLGRTVAAGVYAPRVPTLALDRQATRPGGRARVAEPVTIAIAHNKGGVAKTTSTYILGRHLARSLRVELVDLDRTR